MTYFVGIDIAKYKHDFCILTNDAEIIKEPATFLNNAEGFNALKEALDHLDHSQKIKIGHEATGHYGKNLKQFLTDNGYEFLELNPYLVKKFIECTTLRKTKTDKKDCIAIANFIESNDIKTYRQSLYNNNDLKVLIRNRDKLIRQRSDQLVIITNVLDRIFPEFKRIFDNKLGKCALSILEKFPSAEKISHMTVKQMDLLRKLGRRISINKLMSVRDTAKVTVGHHSKADELVLKEAIVIHNTINSSIESYESEIKEIMKSIDSPLTSIPGVGIISAATIIAEYNNMVDFPNADKLLAYAGLECSRYQSGTQDFHGRMVKRGSPHLRYALMNLAVGLKTHNTYFANYYLKKIDEGKHYRVALNHLVRKFLRVAFKLVSNNEKFDLDKCN